MKTLQEMLKERAGGDAARAVVDVRGDRVRLLLGAVGNHPRIVLGVEGNSVKMLHPADSREAEAGSEAGDGGDEGATGVRRPVKIDDGEFVDDRDPLQPGESPQAALARIANEGENARQPETVSTTTAISTTTQQDAGIGGVNLDDPAGNSEIKNPVGDDAAGNGAGDAAAKDVDPSDHTKDELVAMAKKDGVEHAANATKADIAAAINAKRAGK